MPLPDPITLDAETVYALRLLVAFCAAMAFVILAVDNPEWWR